MRGSGGTAAAADGGSCACSGRLLGYCACDRHLVSVVMPSAKPAAVQAEPGYRVEDIYGTGLIQSCSLARFD